MYVYKIVDISISVMDDNGDVVGYDRRRSKLSNAPLYIKQDDTSIE